MFARSSLRSGGSLLDQWWVPVVRGALAILFGALAVLWPQLTLLALLALFAAFAILDGIASLVAAVRERTWGLPLIGGLLSLAIGVLTVLWPGAAGLALAILIGAWAIVRGVFDIATAIALRRELRHEWVLALGGLLAVLFGLFLVIWPAAGALALVGLIAGFAFALGVLLIVAGIRLRRMREERAGSLAPSGSSR